MKLVYTPGRPPAPHGRRGHARARGRAVPCEASSYSSAPTGQPELAAGFLGACVGACAGIYGILLMEDQLTKQRQQLEELKGDMHGLKQEVNTSMHGLKMDLSSELRRGMSDLKSDLRWQMSMSSYRR